MKWSISVINRILLLLTCANFAAANSGGNFHYNSHGLDGIYNAHPHNYPHTPPQLSDDFKKNNNKWPLMKAMHRNNYPQSKYTTKNKRSSLQYHFNNNHNPKSQTLLDSDFPKYTFINKPTQMHDPTRLGYHSTHRTTHAIQNKHTQVPLLKNRRKFYFLKSKEEKSKPIKQARQKVKNGSIGKLLIKQGKQNISVETSNTLYPQGRNLFGHLPIHHHQQTIQKKVPSTSSHRGLSYNNQNDDKVLLQNEVELQIEQEQENKFKDEHLLLNLENKRSEENQRIREKENDHASHIQKIPGKSGFIVEESDWKNPGEEERQKSAYMDDIDDQFTKSLSR